ncbi:MAG: hypothetical protein JXR70_01120 [Spirochaetales bacterium]|nr:hypothetical protein [Spirochaetales bacterium]
MIQKLKERFYWPILLIFITGLIMSSCASIDHKLSIAPIDRDYPISASSSIFYQDQIIYDSDVEIVNQFKFKKVYSMKITEREMRLNIAKELDNQIELAGADGISGLKITVTNINTDALDWINIERYSGLVITGGCAAWILAPSIFKQPEMSQEQLKVSLAITGTGLLLFGGSYLHENLGTIAYVFEIEGNAVRFK